MNGQPVGQMQLVTGSKIETFTHAKYMVKYERYFKVQCFAPTWMNAMLQVRRLEKTIEGRSVLSIDALDIDAGEVVAVIGPARSGKTLLIRLLSGMIPLSGGSIVFDGECISRTAGIRQHIGVLFEEDLLYERQSALANLKFYGQVLYSLPTMSATDALVQVGLSDQAQTVASKLTPSSQRRLTFARVLMGPRRFLLLDKPILRADLGYAGAFYTSDQADGSRGRGYLADRRRRILGEQVLYARS